MRIGAKILEQFSVLRRESQDVVGASDAIVIPYKRTSQRNSLRNVLFIIMNLEKLY